MLLTHWSAAFGGSRPHEPASLAGSFTLVLDQSIIVLLVGRLCGYFVNHLAVHGSSGTFSHSFLSACRCTRTQGRCSSPCACSVTPAQTSCLQLALLFPLWWLFWHALTWPHPPISSTPSTGLPTATRSCAWSGSPQPHCSLHGLGVPSPVFVTWSGSPQPHHHTGLHVAPHARSCPLSCSLPHVMAHVVIVVR